MQKAEATDSQNHYQSTKSHGRPLLISLIAGIKLPPHGALNLQLKESMIKNYQSAVSLNDLLGAGLGVSV